MKREWLLPLPGRIFCFLTGRPYNAPWQRFVRKKRLQPLIAFDPIICEYKWSDALSATEKSKVYLLPEKINANAYDGVFQTLVFFDSKANPITEIGGQNPCLVSKRFNDFTDLLSGIIEPHIQDLTNHEMRFDLFDPFRDKTVDAAIEEANALVQSIIEERD